MGLRLRGFQQEADNANSRNSVWQNTSRANYYTQGGQQMSTITVKRRKEIKRHLNNIADGCENRMPFWTVVDLFTVQLMRDAAAAIDALENQSKRKASK